MRLATGVDLIEIERVQAAIERHGTRFLSRIYTAREQSECRGKVESLAGRWAAKEAASKALGCGFGDIGWDEVEIIRTESGAPQLVLHGRAQARAAALGLATWSVSMSHSMGHAMAMVVAFGEA